MNFTNETDFINDTSAFNETESDDSMALGGFPIEIESQISLHIA